MIDACHVEDIDGPSHQFQSISGDTALNKAPSETLLPPSTTLILRLRCHLFRPTIVTQPWCFPRVGRVQEAYSAQPSTKQAKRKRNVVNRRLSWQDDCPSDHSQLCFAL